MVTASGQRQSNPDGIFRLPIYEPAGVYRIEGQFIMNHLRKSIRSDLASAIYEPEGALPTTGVLMANSLQRIQ